MERRFEYRVDTNVRVFPNVAIDVRWRWLVWKRQPRQPVAKSGGFQIGIGGVLGQSSAAGQQLVEGGIKQINDFIRDTTISVGIGTAAGPTAGLVNDVVTAAKNLGDALVQTVSPPPAVTTTPPTTTTTASTTTTTIGFSACLNNLIICEQQPSCNQGSASSQLVRINACESVYYACN
jgi:hypothetical protein